MSETWATRFHPGKATSRVVEEATKPNHFFTFRTVAATQKCGGWHSNRHNDVAAMARGWHLRRLGGLI
jgi:hypothetical protein